MPERNELTALHAENARLIALLEDHGIEWRLPLEPTSFEPTVLEPESSRLSTAEKVALFRRLFRGRTDVYPIRWESKTTGKSGYAPACGNEWLAGVCEKPRIKCGECNNRLLIPLSDQVIYEHLAGKRTVGVYPLLADDSCHFGSGRRFARISLRRNFVFSPLISMRRNGGRMPRRFADRVTNLACRSPLKYHAPATARTLGFSSPAAYRLGMRADSVRPSSATPVPALAN